MVLLDKTQNSTSLISLNPTPSMSRSQWKRKNFIEKKGKRKEFVTRSRSKSKTRDNNHNLLLIYDSDDNLDKENKEDDSKVSVENTELNLPSPSLSSLTSPLSLKTSMVSPFSLSCMIITPSDCQSSKFTFYNDNNVINNYDVFYKYSTTHYNIITIISYWNRIYLNHEQHMKDYNNNYECHNMTLSLCNLLLFFTVERFELCRHSFIISDIKFDLKPMDYINAHKKKDNNQNPCDLLINCDTNDDQSAHTLDKLIGNGQSKSDVLALKTRYNTHNGSDNNKSNNAEKQISKPLFNEWICVGHNSTKQWGTILTNCILCSNITNRVYSCKFYIESLGFGVGITFFGSNNKNISHLNHEKISSILMKNNGIPDNITNCCVLYDNGEYIDWAYNQDDEFNFYSPSQSSHSPITSNQNNKLKSPSCNSKTNKSNFLLVDSSNHKNKNANTDNKYRSDVVSQSRKSNDSNTVDANKNGVMTKSNNFSFDEKIDITEIRIDMQHKLITITNLRTKEFVKIKSFQYNVIQFGFVLRYSKLALLSQCWE